MKVSVKLATLPSQPLVKMTPDALKHIQTICRDWLQQSAVIGDLNLTILPGGPLIETIEVELQSLMMPDGTTISTAVDVNTGARYVSILRQTGMTDVVIETSLEKIPIPIDQRLLPPGDPPPPVWNLEYRVDRQPDPDPVNEEFPLISIGDRVFVLDCWTLEERGYGIVKDIIATIYPYPIYLVEIDGKISRESRFDLVLLSEDSR